MKDITRYRIMRKFRSKFKIGDDLDYKCPDPKFVKDHFGARCAKLCFSIWPNLKGDTVYRDACPCLEWGCATALRKLDAWLRKEKARLGVTE